jgi:hypothetical protein
MASERSDETIQAELFTAFFWIASLPLAMTTERFQEIAERSS